ncbi:hypothetical protein [Maridesulfovibrio sp.]|uniref:hypothetical protein n=1 Tax=Maridesulfovibrio sp. TaxID=2795000 RepID=UPI002A188791|nr:hypothetical protein [Maridesulfovibrio sp.]
MNIRFVIAFAALFILFCLPGLPSADAGRDNFGLNWQFEIDLPQAGIAGTLKGHLTHLKQTDFHFQGEYINQKSPIKTGPVLLSADLRLGSGEIILRDLEIQINRIGIHNKKLQLMQPDAVLHGNGRINTISGEAALKNLSLKIGNLPALEADIFYSPKGGGSAFASIHNPYKLLAELADSYLQGVKEWDKSGNLTLKINLRNITSKPVAELDLGFKDVSAASPDGSVLLDSAAGSITASGSLCRGGVKAVITVDSGEALYDTFYMNFSRYPLRAALKSALPDRRGRIPVDGNVDWQKIGRLHVDGAVGIAGRHPDIRAEIRLSLPEISTPFRLFAVDPMSLGNIQASGSLSVNGTVNSERNGTVINGTTRLLGGEFISDAIQLAGINSRLPFAVKLNNDFLPEPDDDLAVPDRGMIEIGSIKAGPLTASAVSFPLTVSSNEIEFGDIPAIPFGNGSYKISELDMEDPFSKNFVLHGKTEAGHIDLSPFSPSSLPLDGEISGKMEFWMLKDHLSTTGRLTGNIYGGKMSIYEIFAENIFEPSRQFGADFRVRNLDLAKLSHALDIGRITGRMDLDLTDLLIAYGQPAGFKLRVVTTPGSDSDRHISLKAVNTLSVIGTGSGLTGAGVGMFSRFFKEFGYASLGLECTLDRDIFKIRGLIREDGIEYIIKKPLLFGINVVNSNPENLISFSDMLKRLKRVFENK